MPFLPRLSDKQWLIVILCLSALLHVVRIGYPAQPVFDEAHFATYAGNYARSEAVFDIHPPLGKIVHALPLVFAPKAAIENASYITIEYSKEKEKIDTSPGSQTEFGNFPYVQMRLLSALFGVGLIGAVYWLLRSLVPHGHAPVIGALFVALENSLLLNSRLILLDSMYMFLSILALALYFHPRRMALRAGILWGFALLVKLTAVTFLGPIFMSVLLTVNIRQGTMRARNMLIFFAAATLVFFVGVALLNNIMAPVEKRIALYEKVAPFVQDLRKEPPAIAFVSPRIAQAAFPYIKAAYLDMIDTFSGYTIGTGFHPYASAWYEWPLMRRTMMFFVEGRHSIALIGNTFVWFTGLAMILFACARIKKFAREKATRQPVFLFLAGYIFSLIPFITIVKRTTFLYHYFPSLIFSICIAAVIIGNYADHEKPRERRQLFAGIILLALAGFIISAPFTYGFSF